MNWKLMPTPYQLGRIHMTQDMNGKETLHNNFIVEKAVIKIFNLYDSWAFSKTSVV